MIEQEKTVSAHAIPYTKVAMLLHWLIAFAIVGLIASGLWMTGAINVPETQRTAFEVYQIHKASGLTVLVLVVLRVLWRLLKGAPPEASFLSPFNRRFAQFGQLALYALMLVTPLLGWALVSASVWNLPTIWFGQFEWPHLSFLSDLPREDKGPIEEALKGWHELAALSMGALALGHIAMALKHHFWDGHQILFRMLPVKPKANTHAGGEPGEKI